MKTRTPWETAIICAAIVIVIGFGMAGWYFWKTR